MLPSSFMISQITPEGLSPARREISTAASVCPARTRTPPSRAVKGNTWPGLTMSPGPLVASIATETVRALSAAEMPVVTPSFASIEMVKAVCILSVLFAVMGSSPKASTRLRLSARQIKPRPYVAIKLTALGVAICAGMIRSPSFSRSSSSTRMYIRPFRASSIISSIPTRAGRSSLPDRKFSSLANVSAVGFQPSSVHSRSVFA